MEPKIVQNIRQKNLFLARYLTDGLTNLVNTLQPEVSEAALIRRGQGKIEISDALARAIEQKLGLHSGWMDRDNDHLLRTMTDTEYVIWSHISSLSHKSQQQLLEYFTIIRNSQES